MTLLNILVPAILVEATLLMAAFPTMVETARKSSRETRMSDFTRLAIAGGAIQLADFIERHYSDNKVAVLKMAKGVLFIIVLSAALFLGSGYYVATSVVPRVKSTAKQQIGLTEDMLGLFEATFNELPNICYVIACSLVVIALVILFIVGIYYDLPHDLKNIFNPPRPNAAPNNHSRQVSAENGQQREETDAN